MTGSLPTSSVHSRSTAASAPFVRLSDVGYRHANGLVALRDITLDIAQGERVAVIGPSGAGKTTLLRLLAGHIQPSVGHLELLGCTPWSLSANRLRKLRCRLGLIHQAPPLPPRQRVITSVLAGRLGRWSLGRSLISLVYPLDAQGAAEALGRLDLADKLYARCDQLSGGQLQRVSIARVLYQQPDLILADEPVSAMDPVLAAYSLNVLNREAIRRQATLLASLHAVELALAHFPRIIGVRAGCIVFDKPSSAVTPAELETLYANEQLGSDQATLPLPSQPLHVPRC
jgi:phosphonate transport system ATP-binding protein